MVAEVHQPDAVCNRLRQLRSVRVESDAGGHFRVSTTQRLGACEELMRIYGTEPSFQDVPPSPALARPAELGGFQHPELALDLGLFRLYYLEAARELGEQQLALHTRVLDELRRDYALPERREDFLRRVRTLLGYYRSIVELYDRLRSRPVPRTERQREQARPNAELADGLLAATGILVPPPPSARSGGVLGRPRDVSAPGTGSSPPSYDEARRRQADYLALRQDLFETHPIFVFLHQNRASQRRLSSLALAGPGTVPDREVLALLDHGIGAIQAATNAFQRSLRQRDWSNIRPLLDMAKVSLFDAEDAASARLYALARQIDDGVVRDGGEPGLQAALLVAGVVLCVATGGLAAPYVLLVEVALAAAAEVLAVREYLNAERDNLQRASIARLELLQGGIRLATAQADLDAMLWMMLFSAVLATALEAGAPIVSRVLRRARAAADEQVARSGTRMGSAAVSSRPRAPARSAGRPPPGRPAARERAIQREPQPPRRGTAQAPTPETQAPPQRRGASARGVDEATLLANSQVIGQRGGARFRLATDSAGVMRLFRCAS